MTINLYSTNDDNKKVNKSLNIVATSSCNLLGDCSVYTPTVFIDNLGDGALKRINYAYIPEWGRYYYINNVTAVTGGRIKVELKVDVLMSYKNAIYSTRAFVTRQEYEFNNDLVDDKYVIWSGRGYDYKNVGSFDVSQRYYYMTVV